VGHLSFNQLVFELSALLDEYCVRVWHVLQRSGRMTIQVVKAREGLDVHHFEEQLFPRGGDDNHTIHLHPNLKIELGIKVVHQQKNLFIRISKLQLNKDCFYKLEI